MAIFENLMIYYRYPFNNILFSMYKNISSKDPDLNLIGLPDPLFMITDPRIGSGSERNIYVFTTLRLTKVIILAPLYESLLMWGRFKSHKGRTVTFTANCKKQNQQQKCY
jgi:hypothetical protein